MLPVQTSRANELTLRQLATWSDLQQTDATVDSPFFRPEFMQMVAAVRSDVEVAVMRQGQQDVGFFPFQRNQHNLALPVGGKLSEFHGVVVDQVVEWDANELIRQSGLRAWHFDHLIATQTPFVPYQLHAVGSPFMDLRKGFEAYVEAQRASGFRTYTSTLRKSRKLAREVGPLRFEFHTPDPQALQALVRWKTEQYQRTRRLRLFQFPWVVELMRHVQATQGKDFAGVASALYAGNQLVAVHFGIRSRKVLHIWFPAFDRTFEKYSPGLVLFLHLAKEASEDGVQRIDFGKGPERYKASFKSGDIPIAVGAVDTRRIVDVVRRRWQTVKKRIRATPGRYVFDASLHLSHYLREWLAFR